MPFAKGHPKPPGSGRQRGTGDKITVAAKLAQMNCDPILGLARIAECVDNKPEVRVRAYTELAQYLHPKLRAIEVTGSGGGPIEGRVQLEVTYSDATVPD